MKPHTLQQGTDAMNELMKLGFNSQDFAFADEMDSEVGYIVGEPILFDTDSDPKSAYQMYQDYLYSIDPNGQAAEDNYMFELLYNQSIPSSQK